MRQVSCRLLFFVGQKKTMMASLLRDVSSGNARIPLTNRDVSEKLTTPQFRRFGSVCCAKVRADGSSACANGSPTTKLAFSPRHRPHPCPHSPPPGIITMSAIARLLTPATYSTAFSAWSKNYAKTYVHTGRRVRKAHGTRRRASALRSRAVNSLVRLVVERGHSPVDRASEGNVQQQEGE